MLSFGFQMLLGQSRISYLNSANEAEFEFLNNNIFAANKILTQLENDYKKLNTKDYFYLGVTFYLLQDSVNGYNNLKKFAERFGTPSLYLEDIKLLYPQLVVSVSARSKIDSLVRKRKQALQDSLLSGKKFKAVIDSVNYYVDQDRSNRPEGDLKDIKRDIETQLNFLSYLQRNGIPDPYVFGDNYTTILLHVEDPDVLKKYKKFIYDALCKGTATPFDYAILEDRESSFDGKTKYGSRKMKPSKDEIARVNENRKSIGMSVYFNGSNLFPRTSKSFMLQYK